MSIDSSLAKGLVKYNAKALTERCNRAADKAGSLAGLSRNGRYKRVIGLTRQAFGPCLCYEAELGKGGKRWWVSVSATLEDNGELVASLFLISFSNLLDPLDFPLSSTASPHAVERLLQSIGKNDMGKISRIWLSHALSLSLYCPESFHQTSSGPRLITCAEEELLIWRLRDDCEGFETCTAIRADRLDQYQTVYDKAKNNALDGGLFIRENIDVLLGRWINERLRLRDILKSGQAKNEKPEPEDFMNTSESDLLKPPFHIF